VLVAWSCGGHVVTDYLAAYGDAAITHQELAEFDPPAGDAGTRPAA
jgi:hypothetical protein